MNRNDLIPGIFNYCDRWCEQCGYSNKCLVFKKESEQKIKHILRDEDPDDPKIFAQDIADNLTDALRSLHKMLENVDEEIDLNEDIEMEPEPTTVLLELHAKADEFFTNCSTLIKKLELLLSPQSNELFLAENEQKTLHEIIYILSWYSPQILVKCERAKSSLAELDKTFDEELRKFAEEDLNVTVKIMHLGIKKCLQALHNLFGHTNEFSDEIVELLILGDETERELLRHFPEIPNYKRPYFD